MLRGVADSPPSGAALLTSDAALEPAPNCDGRRRVRHLGTGNDRVRQVGRTENVRFNENRKLRRGFRGYLSNRLLLAEGLSIVQVSFDIKTPRL